MPCKTLHVIEFLIHGLPLCAVIGLLIACVLLPGVVPLWIILFFWGFLSSPLFLFPALPRLVLLIMVIILCIGSLQIATVCHKQTLQLGFPSDEIVQVTGRLRFDSTYSVNGNTVVDLSLTQTKNYKGDRASARGSLQALVKGQLAILEGSLLVCRGTMSSVDTHEGFFLIDHLSIQKPKGRLWINVHSMRFSALATLNKKLDLLGNQSAFLLKALILGKSEVGGALIRQMAIQSGCAHVLALSGMHLHCLVALVTTLLSLVIGRRRAKWFSFPIAFCYVLVVGFKPSLVRALIMIGLLQLPLQLSLKQVLTFTCILQGLLFPWTIASTSSLLSYGSLTAIICLAEPLARYLALIFPPKLALLWGTTLVAVFCTAPLALLLFGYWYPIGILVSPLVALLALVLLTCGLCYLLWPITFLADVIASLSTSFMQLCKRASDFTGEHVELGTLIPLIWGVGILLTVVGILKYAGLIIQKRSKKAYDMGFSLRFPTCDN